MRNTLCLITCVALSVALSPLNAQNYVDAGNFQEGARNWALVSFDDKKGTTGFGVSDVTTEATSEALFADFQTLTSDVSAAYSTKLNLLPAAMLPVTFHVMWDKGSVTNPISSPSNNWVQLRIYDNSNKELFNQRIAAPSKGGAKERASFSGRLNIQSQVNGATVEFTAQHSSQTKIPYKVWIDDLVIGTPPPFVYHKGCKGTGGKVPLISGYGQPTGLPSFAAWLRNGPPNSRALLAIGSSNQQYGSLKLPHDFGGGCLLSQDLLAVYFYSTDFLGGVTHQFKRVNPKLKGVKVYLQWACEDKGTVNPLGFTTSAGMRVTIE